MAELADALDLGSSAARLAGSTPVTRTTSKLNQSLLIDFFIYLLYFKTYDKLC